MSRGGVYDIMCMHNEPKLVQNHLLGWFRRNRFDLDGQCSAGAIESVRSASTA